MLVPMSTIRGDGVFNMRDYMGLCNSTESNDKDD